MNDKQQDNHPVELAIDEGIATVTLNRPHVRNAVNDAMRAELTAILERVANDDAVRAIVLTGKGVGFCSGGDIAAMQERLGAPAGTPADIIERLNGSVAHAVQSGVLKSLEEVEGLTLTPGPPAELDKYVRGEAARWQDLISKSNLKLE